MRYEGTVFRPPPEGQSLIIQATIGCPHNRCDFCAMYKQKKFRIRPLAEIKEDIDAAKMYYGDVGAVFLADGNTIAIKTDQLLDILHYLRASFPSLQRVGSYGSAKFVKVKSLDDWKRLREAGLRIIYLGLESGDDEILAEMHKGATAAQMIAAAGKLKEAGILLSVCVVLGLGGHYRWLRHAQETARVLNAMDPDYIRPRTLSIAPDTPLGIRERNGDFKPCTPAETIRELRELIAGLDVTKAEFDGGHVSNYLGLYGNLPEDKEDMLKEIDWILENALDRFTKPRPPRYL